MERSCHQLWNALRRRAYKRSRYSPDGVIARPFDSSNISAWTLPARPITDNTGDNVIAVTDILLSWEAAVSAVEDSERVHTPDLKRVDII